VRRRDFIALLGGAAAAWPPAARAQQPAMPVVEYLSGQSYETSADYLSGFRRGLKDSGYVEGENIIVVYRWAENQFDRLPALATELVHRLSITHNLGGLGSATDWQNLESKESLVIPC
jgi:putative tryptophan/tyrosine transport system substrate-binding protein